MGGVRLSCRLQNPLCAVESVPQMKRRKGTARSWSLAGVETVESMDDEEEVAEAVLKYMPRRNTVALLLVSGCDRETQWEVVHPDIGGRERYDFVVLKKGGCDLSSCAFCFIVPSFPG